MPRTTEQIAADDALTAAIQQVITVYADDDHAYLLSEYVVALARQRFDDDGQGVTAIGMIFRDGDVPEHRALGLLEHARIQLRAVIASDVTQGD